MVRAPLSATRTVMLVPVWAPDRGETTRAWGTGAGVVEALVVMLAGAVAAALLVEPLLPQPAIATPRTIETQSSVDPRGR